MMVLDGLTDSLRMRKYCLRGVELVNTFSHVKVNLDSSCTTSASK